MFCICPIIIVKLLFPPELKKFLSGQQIHALVMSISFTGIGIKTVQCLESWSGGVLISVFGSAQLKDYNVRRKFMQLFFLAPQEKGFFVLNDIFHFVDEEPVHNLQPVFLAQSNFDSKLNAPSTITKPGMFFFSLWDVLNFY